MLSPSSWNGFFILFPPPQNSSSLVFNPPLLTNCSLIILPSLMVFIGYIWCKLYKWKYNAYFATWGTKNKPAKQHTINKSVDISGEKRAVRFHRQQKRGILFKTRTQEPEIRHTEKRNWKQNPLEVIQPSMKHTHIIIKNNNLALHEQALHASLTLYS